MTSEKLRYSIAKEWRPDKWDNPYRHLKTTIEPEIAYDAGADAILEALRRIGTKTGSGTLVIIPEYVDPLAVFLEEK